MLNLLDNKEKVKLNQIEKLIKDEQRWNTDL